VIGATGADAGVELAAGAVPFDPAVPVPALVEPVVVGFGGAALAEVVAD
jgi:hypothetical protein